MDNISDIFERNKLLWGEESQEKLFRKHVVVFGLGGVGSYAAEALARSGIGQFTLIDFDTFAYSNINRQLLATVSSVGKNKTDIMEQRLKDINPNIQVKKIKDFYTLDLNENIFCEKVDYVVDAIDSLKFKIDLIKTCYFANIPIITSMGAGNRLCPEKLYIADISEVRERKCPFIKNMKHRLKLAGITKGLTVVTSDERPIKIEKQETVSTLKTQKGDEINLRKFTPGSSPFVPPVAGYIMASYVVRDLINYE